MLNKTLKSIGDALHLLRPYRTATELVESPAESPEHAHLQDVVREYLSEITRTAIEEGTVLNTPAKLALVFRPYVQDAHREVFLALPLDAGLHPLTEPQIIALSGHKEVSVDITLLLRTMLTVPGVDSVAICHNHPSGTIEPSASDNMLTDMIKNALAAVDLGFVDHLILGNGYYSYALTAQGGHDKTTVRRKGRK
jgi:DNA repair protein RadC